MIRRTVIALLVATSIIGVAALILFALGIMTSSASAAVVGMVLLAVDVALAIAGLIVVSKRATRRLDGMATRMSGLDARLHEEERRGRTEAVQATERQAEASQRLDSIGGMAARSRAELRILRRRVPAHFLEGLETSVTDLGTRSTMPRRLAFESALQLGRAPATLIDQDEARALYAEYVERGDYLALRPLIENFDVLTGQRLTDLRMLFQFFRRTGYWDLAARVAGCLYDVTGRDSDHLAVEKMQQEITVFREPTLVRADLPDGEAYDPAGPIIHMVGRVLPDTQTGYTLRTQYTASAQAARGLRPVIVGQSGIMREPSAERQYYEVEGIEYFVLPGRRRNEYFLDEWLRSNMEEFARVVLELRPSILHAQSDFFNALIVDVVGKRYGIPTVYESRGFWEESWLSRIVNASGWARDQDARFSIYGRPPAYELRKQAEESARLLPDHVFTLAEVMRNYILESASGAIDPDRVTIVPNAVDTDAFPVQERDEDLAAQIGLPEGSVTIGYISSIVEYEGIDTLLEAFRIAQLSSGVPMCLLLVGDGDYTSTLRQHAADAGIANVYFTGRVPHEDILRYYGLIDVFVVPRKKSDVTDLVTPLKPFEAFSTGRTVVLSDVGALREIATQCQAVELFRAGDAEDLARVLQRLLVDPDLRGDLASRAANWVRNHRTWLGNVGEYYRVYRKLGYDGPRNALVEAELALAARHLNAGEIIQRMAETDIPRLTGWFSLEAMRQTADDIVGEGWRYKSFEPVKVTQIENWSIYGATDRTWGFNVHTLAFLEPLLREYDKTEDVEWLRTALRIALNWIAEHPDADADDDPMAWYDMSLALRVPYLLALTLRVAQFPELRDGAVILAEELSRHLDELHRDRAFNANNNHGFYTAASQLHMARFAPWFDLVGSARAQGEERMRKMAATQFASDGVHLEHSPDYHRMLLRSFERAVEDGLITDDEIRLRISRAANVLGWMVQPDGNIVQFGDSPETRMVLKNAASIDPETLFILKNGKDGTPPSVEMKVFSEGGYAFVRSPLPKAAGDLEKSGYIAFSAAFHSRAHKHADDLTLVWYDRGQQILTDSGRYGYGELLPPNSPLRNEGFYYASTERQYFEGTMAHNTLMVDGRNQDRRKRAPYGSGLTECAQGDGVFDLSARVHHTDYIHRRRLVFRPGDELLIKDSVFSQSPDTREGVLWSNISGHFELEKADDEIIFVSTGENSIRLKITSSGRLIEPVRGQMNPMRGWRSRQDRSMEPTWSVGFAFPIEVRASVTTLFKIL
ncbi:glycosyltransferase [Brachybacterium sp. AOP3-A1-3]|uniref:glycosyltransferase n=1 Tax=Brachybacterium sp. AOP3-A1-3 TaxID=3457699 RepID=UPI004034DB72